MKLNKKGIASSSIIIVILLVLLVGSVGYTSYDKFIKNDEPKEGNVEETLVKEVKNAEVKSLLGYVASSIKSNNVCLGDYYLKPYSNHTLNNKIALVLINYAKGSEKELTSDQLKTATKYGATEGLKYVDFETVKEGLKNLYNLDLKEEELTDGSSYGTSIYVKGIGFIKLGSGGNYSAVQKQAVIDYKENTDTITVTMVQAELGLDGNVYRYANNPETKVLENASSTFEFTKENISLFPQVKYTFSKNDLGKYYLNNVENLNFTEDFEDCK